MTVSIANMSQVWMSNTNTYNAIAMSVSTLGNGASSNSSLLVFNVDGDQKFRVDAVGRVRKPYQPLARISHTPQSSISFTSGVTVSVPFNSIVEQKGSNYNTSTYRFTAPISGSYLVTAACQGNNLGANWYNMFIRVNGANRFGTYMNGLSVSYQPFYTYGITSVSVGDYFDVAITSNITSGSLELGSVDSRNMFCIYFLG